MRGHTLMIIYYPFFDNLPLIHDNGLVQGETPRVKSNIQKQEIEES